MAPLVGCSLIFLAGLTAGGLPGAWLELRLGARLTFAKPFVSPDRVVRSAAAVAVSGPYMLVNDALALRREGRVSLAALLACLAGAFAWAVAIGIVASRLVLLIAETLG